MARVFPARAFAARDLAVHGGEHRPNPSSSAAAPSSFVALSALAWAHLTAAKLADRDYSDGRDADKPGKLPLAVNWKSRVSEVEAPFAAAMGPPARYYSVSA